ncbi:hypothetical protein EG329_000826 [Mollisiaceae sp. DMI_Dod_QoI]|nr:hypothetical protein EG329_000826 [Helotiales sp. DMI_Dod_QoI]
MVSLFSALFPPAPSFKEKDLPDLTGKVFIITGAASGVGFELAKMLYVAGGIVYIAARSVSRCKGAIANIEAQVNGKKAEAKLKPMVIDLADLSTVKAAVDEFLRQETQLDVLIHNAAVMNALEGSKGKQGQDLEMVTNCVAPYLLTKLLEPILIRTAVSSPPFCVRIVFVVALMQFFTPASAMLFDGDGTPRILPGDKVQTKPGDNYMQTKAGGTWLAAEFANRLGSKGILSTSVHPGLMRTELQRNMAVSARVGMKLLFKGPVYGAYSELFAAFSPELKAENNGGYVMAWGRIAELPRNITHGLRSKAEGGSGEAKMFVDYCERETIMFQQL